MEFTKTQLEQIVVTDLPMLYRTLTVSSDSKEVLFILQNLGYLPAGFDGSVLFSFLNHKNEKIRFWAVKNLGKLRDVNLLPLFVELFHKEKDTTVRREIVSSIGRLHSENAIEVLINILEDKDPKVILQAVRGLLVFKNNKDVLIALRSLQSHPNEMIQAVLKKELFPPSPIHQTTIPHTVSLSQMQNVAVLGDVRRTLTITPEESVHLTFTSPPYYNARDYSIYESYQAYLDFLEEVFTLVMKVTKEGRFLVVNTSPIIIPRVSRAHASKRYPIPFDLHGRLSKLGWEFIDDIVWQKPETSVKNRNAGFLQHRKPLAYKPNAVTEYLMVYRKPTERLIDWNIHQYPDEVVEESKIKGTFETSNIWRIDPTFDRIHSAVFPLELCKRVIEYYSFMGDLVFDPFAGSGTVGKAARSLGRKYFLTEIDENYFQRIKTVLQESDLFSQESGSFLTFEDYQQSLL